MTIGVGVLLVIQVAVAGLTVAEPVVFYGASDASAAVALDARHFVVADDENNNLRIYRIDQHSAPVKQIDLTSFLSVDDKFPESDIEGSARVGDRIYWITSHGRNKDGKERPNRYTFFATDVVKTEDEDITLRPVGRPYRRLAYDLMYDPVLQGLKLGEAIGLDRSLSKKQMESLAPKDKGLNIEGLAVGPDGTMLIGLRNPVHKDPVSKKDKAILLVLKNPEAMVINSEEAQFASPILLDIEGLGIRSIEQVVTDAKVHHIIAAGTANGKNRFGFYDWAGHDAALQKLSMDLPDEFTPEAMFQLPGTETIWILSDDGTIEKTVSCEQECLPGELLKNGKCPNKFLVDPGRRTFRAIQMHPDKNQ
jgi:hypothetical protein